MYNSETNEFILIVLEKCKIADFSLHMQYTDLRTEKNQDTVLNY
jgi:hypothetical protein